MGERGWNAELIAGGRLPPPAMIRGKVTGAGPARVDRTAVQGAASSHENKTNGETNSGLVARLVAGNRRKNLGVYPRANGSPDGSPQ